MVKEILKTILIIILLILIAVIFYYYLIFIFKRPCLKLGYTLCAAIGEDFFALYQAAYNFLNNNFIYGRLASRDLITPYFMIYKYFPIGPLVVGFPYLFVGGPQSAYNFYLLSLIICHFLGAIMIFFLAKKFKVNFFQLILVLFFWFTFFPLLSDWRMGQFNYLAGFFFFLSLSCLSFSKKILGGFLWLYSIAIKPVAILFLPFFLKKKQKLILIGFILFFVVFSAFYLLYHQLYNPLATKDFLNTMLLGGNRVGWQVHYPDNFSINSFLAELFFDKHKNYWPIISGFYSAFIIFLYLFITFLYLKKISAQESQFQYLDLYYGLFSLSTLIVFHKEVWESWLILWLIILVFLILSSKKKKELFLIIMSGLLLSTPSLFYFYELYQGSQWRLLLIAEKAIPQLILFYLITKKLLTLLNFRFSRQNFKNLLVLR